MTRHTHLPLLVAALSAMTPLSAAAQEQRYMFGCSDAPINLPHVYLSTNIGTFVSTSYGKINFDGRLDTERNSNYATGRINEDFFRSYFLFDLYGGLANPVAWATISLWNPASPPPGNCGFSSSNATEVFSLRALDPFDLSGPFNIDAYSAIGSGVGFGSATISEADDTIDPFGKFLAISLNDPGLAALNRAFTAGGQFGVGGMLEGLGDPPPPGGVVPEPATMTLLATGLVGITAARRKRREA